MRGWFEGKMSYGMNRRARMGGKVFLGMNAYVARDEDHTRSVVPCPKMLTRSAQYIVGGHRRCSRRT